MIKFQQNTIMIYKYISIFIFFLGGGYKFVLKSILFEDRFFLFKQYFIM